MRSPTVTKALTALMLTLYIILPTLVSCAAPATDPTPDSNTGNTAPDTSNRSDISAPSYTADDAKKIPAVYEALRAHFRLGEGEELTEEMLAEVTSISISPSKWNSKISGYCLVDVIINGDDKFCGAMPIYMEESTHANLLKQLKDKHTPTEQISAFNMWYVSIDPHTEGITDSEKYALLTQYPECASGAIRVLNADVPNDTMLWIFEYLYASTSYFENKQVKTNCDFDSSLFVCYPNLKNLELFGFGLDGKAPDGVEVLITKAYTTYNG